MTDEPPAGKPPARRRGRPPKARGAAMTGDKGADKWTLRGVPSNVRAMALKAAAARGLTLGDYVSEAIVSYSRSAGKDISADKLPAKPLAEMLVDMQERLERIEREQRQGFFARLFGRRGEGKT